MASPVDPASVHPVTTDDVFEALGAGIRDFRAAPKYGLAFGLLYAMCGWLLVALVWHLQMPYLAYPLAMGFALIAPFAVVGLYAVSDKLERHEPVSWGIVVNSIKDASRRELRWMALVTGFAMVLWLDIAAMLLFAYSGINGFDAGMVRTLLMTPSGLLFLILGNASGALIAFGVFSISVISFPMLYDRNVDFVTAMTSSVRLVMLSPVAMMLWCVIIAAMTGLSLLSGFLGLIIVLPIVGHATWHLYRRTSPRAPAALPRPSDVELVQPSAKPV